MEQRIGIERMEEAINLFGSFDENIRLLETEFQVQVVNRGGELVVSGEPENVMLAVKAVQALLTLSNKGESISDQHVRYVIGLVRSGQSERISELTQDVICITSKGRPVKPKTIGQKEYVNAILKQTVTIGVGPAGTGKTYLAVAAAVAAFRDKQVNRIILTRPAVEAGERLGFLPGDLQSKVDPYLRPLYDALFDMLGAETYQKYLERGNIEVAPLAYMRGRTLDDSFIILDEAQNTSREQMKMFLTRMGFGSKVVITGDVTQIDLPADKISGLKEAMKVLRDVEGVAICKLTKEDVVRHVMVQRIIEAYAKFEEKRNETTLYPCDGGRAGGQRQHKELPEEGHPHGPDGAGRERALRGGRICHRRCGHTGIEPRDAAGGQAHGCAEFSGAGAGGGRTARGGGCGRGHRLRAAGRHGHLAGAGEGAGQGVRPQQPAGAGVPGGTLGAAPAGLRPHGRGTAKGADAGAGGDRHGRPGSGTEMNIQKCSNERKLRIT